MDTISSPERLRVFDFAAGLALCAIAAKIFAASLGYIAQTAKTGAPYYKSAGFFPAVVSSLLFVCACSLLHTALKSILNNMPERALNGDSKFKYLGLVVSENLYAIKKGSWFFLSVLGWLGFYIFILLEYLPYTGATCIFLFVFMALFHIKERSPISVKQGAIMLLTAFLMALFISFLFHNVARIPLP